MQALIKKIFPKPKLPQKRYLFLAFVIIYLAMKFYVLQTPSTLDDNIPDQIKEATCQFFSDNENQSVEDTELG